jgi:hypothetical protein
MISLLVPTRKRPEKLRRMTDSVWNTVKGVPGKSLRSSVEILCYVTDDDDSYAGNEFDAKIVRGPRLIMSDLWNTLLPHAHGDILMQCADDVVFRTPAWDRYVEEAFAAVEDKILLVHGHDLHPRGEFFATLPFVSREWVQAVGYFTGPGFSNDFSDTWPNDVADMIGRNKYIPVVFEHVHWMLGKAEMDETYREVEALRRKDNTTALYNARLPERVADAEKLRKAMR